MLKLDSNTQSLLSLQFQAACKHGECIRLGNKQNWHFHSKDMRTVVRIKRVDKLVLKTTERLFNLRSEIVELFNNRLFSIFGIVKLEKGGLV